jgi:cytidylate kinase
MPEVLSQIVARDHRDASRAVGPLAVPPDAEVIDTTPIDQEQVIARIVAKANALRRCDGEPVRRRDDPADDRVAPTEGVAR